MHRCRGFIDIQVNGFMGIDFSMPGLTLRDIRKVTLELSKRGTAGYCPTVCTGPMEMYKSNLAVMAESILAPEIDGRVLGIHIEGPFISPSPGAIGVHRRESVRLPSMADFDLFQEWAKGTIRLLTLAPEIAGAEELIRHATKQGVSVMLGHHYADNKSMESARSAGAIGCTHVGNAIPNEIHRHNNPIWWQLACNELYCTFITDGHHLPADFIKVALCSKGIDHFVVISDSAPIAGMPPGEYESFGKKVIVEPSGRIICKETQGFAGSNSSMLECMNYLSSLGILTEDELYKVSFTNPLKILGIDPDTINMPSQSVIEFDGKQFQVVSV